MVTIHTSQTKEGETPLGEQEGWKVAAPFSPLALTRPLSHTNENKQTWHLPVATGTRIYRHETRAP